MQQQQHTKSQAAPVNQDMLLPGYGNPYWTLGFMWLWTKPARSVTVTKMAENPTDLDYLRCPIKDELILACYVQILNFESII